MQGEMDTTGNVEPARARARGRARTGGVGCLSPFEIKTAVWPLQGMGAADNAGVGGRALRRGRPAAGCEAHRRTPGC